MHKRTLEQVRQRVIGQYASMKPMRYVVIYEGIHSELRDSQDFCCTSNGTDSHVSHDRHDGRNKINNKKTIQRPHNDTIATPKTNSRDIRKLNF